ncbi:MAG: hypothetical protein AAF624_05565 [Bacteroidota bacterium]
MAASPDESDLPGMALSLAPIVLLILLPILLITVHSVVKGLAQAAIPIAPLRDPTFTEPILAAAANGVGIAQLFQWTNPLGNPNFALLLSDALAEWTYQRQRRPSAEQFGKMIEGALMSGEAGLRRMRLPGEGGRRRRPAQRCGAPRPCRPRSHRRPPGRHGGRGGRQ